MPAKSRFTRLDAFTKTVEDARVRTTSGGIVTITSLIIILYLIWGEWSDYRKILVQPELIVDKGRGQLLNIQERRSHGLIPSYRREDGDCPQHHLPSNTLRAAHLRCDGCVGRTTNWSCPWSEQGAAKP